MPATRYDHHGNECLKIFKEIGTEDCKMEQIGRLGRRSEDGRDRPMLVKMSMEKGKWKILSQSKKLINSSEQMRKVYINRDMTKDERAIEYHLRGMLAEKWRGKLVDTVRGLE